MSEQPNCDINFLAVGAGRIGINLDNVLYCELADFERMGNSGQYSAAITFTFVGGVVKTVKDVNFDIQNFRSDNPKMNVVRALNGLFSRRRSVLGWVVAPE